ncbi:DUF4058 family protein [Armatimonas sp.]|uniref:DUF4058 family protein n=1 Tax=Armatimonas sp. TaxID=1872638 RepID=UPI00374CBF6F
MPSPFPGMDPWLENRILWQGFHNVFISLCMAALNRALPEGVVATTELRIQRFGGHDVRPDIGVVNRFATSPNVPRTSGRSGLALAERPVVAPLVIPIAPPEERQAFITLRDALYQERVLTVIEILSPSNKTGRGYEQYRAKQDELLESETSLIEIDLLRAGAHTVAVPVSSLRERGAQWEYLICLHDVTDRWNFQVWPLLLADRLPTLPIPLGEDYSPVTLDLQAVFSECYDTGRYGALLRYQEPPEVPLSDEQVQWAQEQRK